MAKLISSLLQSELANFIQNSDPQQTEKIITLKKKFESLKNLNIPINDSVFILKKKEPIFFTLSNGTIFISEVPK